jgi:hypothetical protein
LSHCTSSDASLLYVLAATAITRKLHNECARQVSTCLPSSPVCVCETSVQA